MQSIVSGPSTERVVRTLLLILLIDGFTIAYLWDGYVGYARRNANELVRLLGFPADAAPPINSSLTAGEAQRIAQTIKAGDELSAVTAVLGRPSLEHGGDAYFLGPGGWLKVQLTGSRIASAAWTSGPKTESDQQWQRWIGYALAVGGLIVAIRLALVLTTRLTLSDDGLWIRGRRLVPFDAITALRADPAGRSGCVEIEYSLDGRLQRVGLDRYVYKRLPEIVAAICERKGFSNPWAAATTAAGRA
jgi:hypothetical protein